jgi:hypothetical protein
MNNAPGVWKGIFIVLAVIGAIALLGFFFMFIMHGLMMSSVPNDLDLTEICGPILSPRFS